MSWQLVSFLVLGAALAGGFAWYERARPPAKILALVAALAALAVIGRIAFAPIPNVKPTTDIVLLCGYVLGGGPGFAIGAIAALVSNIFFGQGPWTPWQMVAWGAVGVGGAALARATGAWVLGRWSLALACAAAGIGFGLVMDVYQWSLAAEQTLASYLAVSGTSLPYNFAHVLGNVLFCLLIGPALVTALRRYKHRFEVTWPAPARSAGVSALIAAVALALPGAALAGTGDAARFLERAQNRDGGLGEDRGKRSSRLLTGWAALGLAATGRNPQDVVRKDRSVTDYLREHASIRDVGELERTVLVLVASGLSPTNFAGEDLVARLRRKRSGNGSWSGLVNHTAFGILALDAAGDTSGLQKSSRWLAARQNKDGGFAFNGSGVSDVDVTAAVMQAFVVTGDAPRKPARDAVKFLEDAKNRDGGFGQRERSASNAQSTAWAIQGLESVGRNPARAGGGRNPLHYLRSLQAGDGSVRYSRARRQTPVWVTAQATLALERKPFPLSAVARDPTVAKGSGKSSADADSTATVDDETTAPKDASVPTPDFDDAAPAPSDEAPAGGKSEKLGVRAEATQVAASALPLAAQAAASLLGVELAAPSGGSLLGAAGAPAGVATAATAAVDSNFKGEPGARVADAGPRAGLQAGGDPSQAGEEYPKEVQVRMMARSTVASVLPMAATGASSLGSDEGVAAPPSAPAPTNPLPGTSPAEPGGAAAATARRPSVERPSPASLHQGDRGSWAAAAIAAAAVLLSVGLVRWFLRRRLHPAL